jgi:hypothetical protein
MSLARVSGIGGIGRVDEQANDGRRGDQLVKQLQPFRPYLHVQGDQARDVAARPVETGDQSDLDWVGRHREDDRNRRGCRFGRHRRRRATRDNHGHLTANQIGRQCRQSVVLVVRPEVFGRHVPALDIAGFGKALVERAHTGHNQIRRSGVEEPDHRQRRLLRARRERPCCHAAEERDEIAAFHSITSSARSKIDGGTARPSASAVLKLTTISNFVGS